MAGNIKGITIEFRGDATPLQKAIRKVDSEASKTQKELSAVNNSLKFNPTSVDLWRQKQQLLTTKISQTEEKLDMLRQAQKKMDDANVDKNSEEYRKLQREIIETGSKLKTFKRQLREIGNVKLKALSEEFKKIGKKATDVGRTMTTKVTGPIVAGYTVAAKYASDYEENLNKLDVAFGNNSDSVKAWANTARTEFGLSKVQATDAASAFGALGKGIGLTEKDAAEMSTTLTGLSADLGSYFNVSTEDSAKALEGIFTGESEALKKFGVVMTDTNLKAFAEDAGLVWSEMSQAEKTQLRYNYVLAKTEDAQGDFARTSDGTANSIKILKATLQDIATAIGTNLLPIITPIVQKISEWLGKFNELSPQTQKIITIIGLVVAAVGPLLLVFGTMATMIGNIINLVGMIGPVIAGLAGPIGIAIAAVTAAIAVGVLLYKNWDKIKAKAAEIAKAISAKWQALKTRLVAIANSIKTAVMNAFNNLKSRAVSVFASIASAMISPVRGAVAIIKALIDKIKGFFKFTTATPHVKLPHFSIRPKGWKIADLLKGKIPKLGVEWYATGGIFSSPSIIGVGESGSEAVVPLDKLWKHLDGLSSGGEVVINVYPPQGSSVEAIAREVERRLIATQNRSRAAWQ